MFTLHRLVLCTFVLGLGLGTASTASASLKTNFRAKRKKLSAKLGIPKLRKQGRKLVDRVSPKARKERISNTLAMKATAAKKIASNAERRGFLRILNGAATKSSERNLIAAYDVQLALVGQVATAELQVARAGEGIARSLLGRFRPKVKARRQKALQKAKSELRRLKERAAERQEELIADYGGTAVEGLERKIEGTRLRVERTSLRERAGSIRAKPGGYFRLQAQEAELSAQETELAIAQGEAELAELEAADHDTHDAKVESRWALGILKAQRDFHIATTRYYGGRAEAETPKRGNTLSPKERARATELEAELFEKQKTLSTAKREAYKYFRRSRAAEGRASRLMEFAGGTLL
jgi:hypothetical protein